jgi:NAD(P)-dependent dehydrogenase (short-subunit alcohol dehydrogenase family)
MAVTYSDLQDKNVVITGGASGLGFAIANGFVQNNANVIIVGRDKEKLQIAKSELNENAHCIAFDLNDSEQISNFTGEIKERFGGIDVLVNNAGVNLKKAAFDVTNKEYQDIISINQTAVFTLTRETGRMMAERGKGGSIIMISSMASQYGIPKVVGYTASKSAVEGMTRALAVEWGQLGIRVNCIAPGFIVTTMSSRALENDPERKHKVLSRTPMGKLGEPQDIANAALFLASKQAKYITGVVLPVDGGNSIGF